MKFNDPFTRANRAARTAGADDRVVELMLPLGLELDEDSEGNVFIKSIEKNSRAEKSGKVKCQQQLCTHTNCSHYAH